MALYAFDGTWNKDESEEGADTNVVKFAEAYTEETCYRPGVGTRFGKIGKIFGGVFGAGSEQRLDEMLAELKSNLESGDTTIDVIGFSRGAAIALEFCNLVNEAMAAAPYASSGFGIPWRRSDCRETGSTSDTTSRCRTTWKTAFTRWRSMSGVATFRSRGWLLAQAESQPRSASRRSGSGVCIPTWVAASQSACRRSHWCGCCGALNALAYR